MVFAILDPLVHVPVTGKMITLEVVCDARRIS